MSETSVRTDPPVAEPADQPVELDELSRLAPRTAGPARWRRLWHSRLFRWCLGLVATLVLIGSAIIAVQGTVGAQTADDPRSNLAAGTGALHALLSAEGIDLVTTADAADAAARSDVQTTIVVANPDRLAASEAAALMAAPHGRLVLLRPNTPALQSFGVDADAKAPGSGVLDPGCPEPAAVRAGPIVIDDPRASYHARASATVDCYPSGAGSAWLRVQSSAGAVDLVAGGISNADLGTLGNAAFAMNVFGSEPQIVWLMAERPTSGDDTAPGLLPSWWQPAALQLVVAVTVIGIWRGRRLGPILVEPLPVTVRASETMEGHGRLYYRLGARDRAAEALRAGARTRLGGAFGHADDPLALSGVIANRTGRDPAEVRRLLSGPPPATDDQLSELARHLDLLEQEARRP